MENMNNNKWVKLKEAILEAIETMEHAENLNNVSYIKMLRMLNFHLKDRCMLNNIDFQKD